MKERVIAVLAVCLVLVVPKLWAAESQPEKPNSNPDTAQPASTQSAPESDQQLKARINELERRLDELEQIKLQWELAQIKAEAAAVTESQTEELKPKSFKGGARSLQALNPEISAVGDFFVRGVIYDDKEYAPAGTSALRSGAFFRILGLHFQANLDPFSYMKAAVGVTPEGVELGEAYMVFSAILPRTMLMIGKFRQQFGVVNRWHKPGLDQFDFPLALKEYFGPGGLNQVGASAEVALPALWAKEETLVLQITNAQNPKLFSGEFFSIPAVLGRLSNYWDLSRNTYLELGFTGLWGTNNKRGYFDEQDQRLYDEKRRYSIAAGADLTLNWEPVNQAKYRGFTWRTEFYYVRKEEKGLSDPITAMGGYSYLQYKFARFWIVGVRGDFLQPFAPNNSEEYIYAATPYLTWWQSPWVRFRLQYTFKHGSEDVSEKPQHLVIFQVTFAAGPHKHERY